MYFKKRGIFKSTEEWLKSMKTENKLLDLTFRTCSVTLTKTISEEQNGRRPG